MYQNINTSKSTLWYQIQGRFGYDVLFAKESQDPQVALGRIAQLATYTAFCLALSFIAQERKLS
jgi:hypothetical protein